MGIYYSTCEIANAWNVLAGDPWVLNTVVGYQIPIKVMPVQAQRPPEARF